MSSSKQPASLREGEIHTHGDKGVFNGGEWVPMEAYKPDRAAASGTSFRKSHCGNDCSTCPRSESCHPSAKADGSYVVIIIGAGCIGAAVARELSKTTAHVLWLEAADDVAQGATKGNSGIVHAGFDDKPGSVRAKFCPKGNQMFPELDKQLNFGYQKNGSLVLARNEAEVEILKDLLKRGQTNGVKNLSILGKEELFKKEPYLHPDTIAALYAPDAGNLIPYEYTIALAENAVDNGVHLKIRREVTKISTVKAESGDVFEVQARYWEPASYVSFVESKDRQAGGNPLYYSGACLAFAALFYTQAGLLADKFNSFAGVAAVSKESICIAAGFYVMLGVIMAVVGSKGAKKSRKPGGNYVDLYNKASLPEGKGGEKASVEDMAKGGSGSAHVMKGETVAMESYRAKYIVNCAGTYSDKIAALIGDNSFQIKPRLGDYLLLNKNQGHLATHTLFPCPDEKLGKGVLVQTTLWGNLILGPTARDMHIPEIANESSADIKTYILSKCKALVPSFDPKEVIHAFSGSRAKSSRGDWIIEASKVNKNFINAAGIDSPGLAGSPAIAVEVVRLLTDAGLSVSANASFNPYRAPIIVPKNGLNGLKYSPITNVGKVTDPSENVICKCEKVTEAEVVDAIHRSLPVDSTQAIRKRTRAGMGHCQGNVENYNCECRVAAIIARETGYPIESISRRPWPATSSLSERWIDAAEKQEMEKLKNI